MYYSGTAGVWFGQSKWIFLKLDTRITGITTGHSCIVHFMRETVCWIIFFPQCALTPVIITHNIFTPKINILESSFCNLYFILSFYIYYTLICLTYECVINIKKVEDVILSLHSLIFSDVNWFVIQPNFRDKSFNGRVYQTTCNYLNNIQ